MASCTESLPKTSIPSQPSSLPSLTRIAIDTVFFNRPYSGITRVWENILNNITTFSSMNGNEPNYEIILLIRGKNISNSLQDIIRQNKNGIHNNKFQLIEIPDFNYITMMQDVDNLNYICKQNNIHYFLSTYFTYCTTIPNILMIHDMIPEIFNMAPNHMWQQKDLAIKNASQFIVISNNTKNDLIKYYPHIKMEKYSIALVYNSVPSQNMHLQSVKYDDKFLNNILLNNGILPKKYIFAMATNNEKYKNIQLIQNLAAKYQIQLCQKLATKIPIILLIKQQLPNGYAISNGVFYVSNISDEILNTLYKNALCYVNPSLYEGFGLPVFEAFSHSIPVIALSLPIYQESAPNAINFVENDVDELFDKICFIHKNIHSVGHMVNKRIENGLEVLEKYSLGQQIQAVHTLFTSLTQHTDININAKFLNLIFQSYNETNPERQKELLYCIQSNLDNPYVSHIHDFGYQSGKYLPDTITKHPKYISVSLSQLSGNNNSNANTWLTYETAFKYSNLLENITKYGSYWGIINCDIFLECQQSHWQLIRGGLNSGFIFAQSRHEFNILPNGETVAKMDDNFAKMYHANTQDAWFYKSPIQIATGNNMVDVSFELGMLGCDNAIADRLVKAGYKVINQPETFKIMHYDVTKGKNSSNYLEKHSKEDKEKNNANDNANDNRKPKNKHPERKGSYLVPNYNQLLGNNANIDLNSIANGMGGLSNQEKYKIISEMYSSRIIIANPD